VQGRDVRLVDSDSLAGGVSCLLDQVRWCVTDLGVPLPDAVRAASTTPARALAFDGVGALAAGLRADVLVVDDRAAVLAEGGDVVQAIASGAITPQRIGADLRDLARGAHPGRTRDDQVTLFKSVGFALEDFAAADAVLRASG
jgi:ornithine cyclodeaminase/alanine dehydrogenase-like protein (mu-crystallin family)